ncbi:MAG: hypothetical protein WBW33_37735 [Bryobacteraceae bacterium]
MRRILMFLTAGVLAVAATVPPSPELLHIKTVYIMPMRLGFDQYLANQLSQSGLLRVVTDPKKADGILTDHLGESFEARLDEINPPPKPPPPPAAEAAPTAPKGTSDAAKSTDPAEGQPEIKTKVKKAKSTATDAIGTESSPPPRGSFSSGRGNVFLVDKTSRVVLWSTFEQLDSAQPANLTHIAVYVVKDLKHALQLPKVKQN